MPFTAMPDMGADEVDETVGIAIAYKKDNKTLINYPNPFQNQTTIEFDIRTTGFVRLSIVDFTGKEIQKLISSILPAGNHQLDWKTEGLPAGIYFLRLQTNGLSEGRKLLLLE